MRQLADRIMGHISNIDHSRLNTYYEDIVKQM